MHIDAATDGSQTTLGRIVDNGHVGKVDCQAESIIGAAARPDGGIVVADGRVAEVGVGDRIYPATRLRGAILLDGRLVDHKTCAGWMGKEAAAVVGDVVEHHAVTQI